MPEAHNYNPFSDQQPSTEPPTPEGTIALIEGEVRRNATVLNELGMRLWRLADDSGPVVYSRPLFDALSATHQVMISMGVMEIQ